MRRRLSLGTGFGSVAGLGGRQQLAKSIESKGAAAKDSGPDAGSAKAGASKPSETWSAK